MGTPTTQQRERLQRLERFSCAIDYYARAINKHGFDASTLVELGFEPLSNLMERTLGELFAVAKEMVEAGDLSADEIERHAS